MDAATSKGGAAVVVEGVNGPGFRWLIFCGGGACLIFDVWLVSAIFSDSILLDVRNTTPS